MAAWSIPTHTGESKQVKRPRCELRVDSGQWEWSEAHGLLSMGLDVSCPVAA